MRTRTCIGLCIAGLVCVPAVWGQDARAGKAPPVEPLERPVDLSIADAGAADAIRALNAGGQLGACLEGEEPERKVTLSVKGMRARDLLDALGALYGLRWQRRLTMIVFSPRPPGAGMATSGASPTDLAARADLVLAGLGQWGYGPGSAGTDATDDYNARKEGYEQAMALFSAEDRRRMMVAQGEGGGMEPPKVGARLRDLPEASQRALLGWRAGLFWRAIAQHLRQAANLASQARGFDRYLDATVYFKPTGDPNAGPMIMFQGGDAHSGWHDGFSPTSSQTGVWTR